MKTDEDRDNDRDEDQSGSVSLVQSSPPAEQVILWFPDMPLLSGISRSPSLGSPIARTVHAPDRSCKRGGRRAEVRDRRGHQRTSGSWAKGPDRGSEGVPPLVFSEVGAALPQRPPAAACVEISARAESARGRLRQRRPYRGEQPHLYRRHCPQGPSGPYGLHVLVHALVRADLFWAVGGSSLTRYRTDSAAHPQRRALCMRQRGKQGHPEAVDWGRWIRTGH